MLCLSCIEGFVGFIALVDIAQKLVESLVYAIVLMYAILLLLRPLLRLISLILSAERPVGGSTDFRKGLVYTVLAVSFSLRRVSKNSNYNYFRIRFDSANLLLGPCIGYSNCCTLYA